MTRLIEYMQQAPPGAKVVSDIGVWGVVVTGWLGLIQPWLTALATVLALTWTGVQLYDRLKRKK